MVWHRDCGRPGAAGPGTVTALPGWAAPWPVTVTRRRHFKLDSERLVRDLDCAGALSHRESDSRTPTRSHSEARALWHCPGPGPAAGPTVTAGPGQTLIMIYLSL